MRPDAWPAAQRSTLRRYELVLALQSQRSRPQDGLRQLSGPATARSAQGCDRPVEAKAPVRDRVEAIAKAYLKHAKTRTREKTSGETERILRVDVLPIWNGKRLSEITKADVRQLIDGIMRRGAPVAANRTLACIKTMFAFAIEQDILTASPCTGLKPPAAEVSRDRTIG